ncbi:MAG: DUF2807 domain-containing protein [Gammaproteobacteria bacterium]
MLTLKMWAAILGATLAMLASTAISAAEKTMTKEQAFSGVTTLNFKSFSGDLRIEVGDVDQVHLKLSGSPEQVESVRAALTGGALVVSGGKTTATVITANANHVTVVATPGATAQVVIGNQKIEAGSQAQSPLRAQLQIPRGIPLNAERYVGDAVIGDLAAAIQVKLAAGQMKFGKVTDAQLAVEGSGDIEIERVAGNLAIDVEGGGDVRVKDGAIKRLTVDVKGSGDVSVGGRAEQARLSLVGAGDIEVAEVREKPVISNRGAGEISVGNW